jgi:hypothetical protein
MKLKQANEKQKARAGFAALGGSGDCWITSELPDSDMTVLMRLKDSENPIWPGFHDGESWRTADAATVEGPVLGWMELEAAALMLDHYCATRQNDPDQRLGGYKQKASE